MNDNGLDEMLFRGIPRSSGHGSSRFLTSLSIHVGAVVLLLLTAPQIALQSAAAFRLNTVLIAPPRMNAPEEQPVPKHEPTPAVRPVPKPRELKPLPRVAEVHRAVPKLEEAPVLATPRVALPVVAPPPTLRAPVQTGVFGSDAPPKIEAKLPVPAARDAGFDQQAIQNAAPQATIQTGAFGAPERTRSSRLLAANVTATTFNLPADNDRQAPVRHTVQKSGFDDTVAATAPAKPAAASKAPVIRPIEILDKPKPAYTAEARAQKIEGTVLLDVIFAASGEVRVLGVVRGLGHGLDEAATDAARHIRFTPAMQAGRPVDQHVVLHVEFQITG